MYVGISVMTSESGRTPAARRNKGPLIVLAGLAVIGALGAGIYGVGVSRNADEGLCNPAVAVARRIAPLARGEVAAVRAAESALRLPVLGFRDATGQEKTLADWRGRTVLLNLWATWCVPCRKEMPALDALQAKLGGDDFEVVAVNIDTRDPAKPRAWLHDVGIRSLAYYSDTSAKVFQDLKSTGQAMGMPTTLVIDPNGCEIASLAGPAEWASEDGVALISAALTKPAAATR
jgi:thiol-disulfide isomerase/thioredoxin